MRQPAAPDHELSQTRAPTTTGRRERKKREARRKIFQAAFELFLEKGFEHTTVEEIAERADVGKGTVFNYFPRKTSFLAALADDWVSRLTEEMGLVEQWRGSTRKKLERVFLFLADLGVQNPALSRQAFSESLRAMLEGGIAVEKPVLEFHAMIHTLLRQGQDCGEVRADLELEHAAGMIESAFFRTMAGWLKQGGTVDPLRREISAKLDIIFDGVAPRAEVNAQGTNRARRARNQGRRT